MPKKFYNIGGFVLGDKVFIKGLGKKIPFNKKIIQTEIIHEFGHRIWEQIPEKDRERFALSLKKWEEQELPKVIKEINIKEKGYWENPSEVFSRFLGYWVCDWGLPSVESKEGWDVFLKIMGKYENLKEDLFRLSNNIVERMNKEKVINLKKLLEEEF